MTHAFFKALLFLGAGVVILAQHHEHDMFKMGGLKDRLPSTYWTFLIGAASLAALPLVTAGFYSKDLILWRAWTSPSGGPALWLAGLLGAFITSIYTFRMVFITFLGKANQEVSHKPGLKMILPLVILAVLSLVGGFMETPETLGNLPLFSDFMRPVFGEQAAEHTGMGTELLFQMIASLVSLAGIFVAYLLFLRAPRYAENLSRVRSFESIRKFWFQGWNFDELYDRLFVRPFLWVAQINKADVIDSGYTGIAYLNRAVHGVLSKSQTGNIRWYAMGLAVGAVVFLGIIVMLQ
jgi:NADH-quinone oxidoreductase subunit L